MSSGKWPLIIFFVFVLLIGTGSAWADWSDSLIAYWTFNEGQGDIVYDLIGSNDGIINGASWTRDLYGEALNFDGEDDYVSIPDSNVFDFGTGDFSISAWFKTSDTLERPAPFIVNLRQNDNDPHIEIYVIPANGGIGTHILPEAEKIEYRGNVNDGQWHHVVITLDNGVADGYKLYLDGIKRGERTSSPNLNNWDTLTIGHVQPPLHYNSFNGNIDDVAFFNKALAGEEVQQIFNQGIQIAPVSMAISNILSAIDEKKTSLGRVEDAIKKEVVAYDELEKMLQSGDFGELKKGGIIKAMQKINSAIQHEEQSLHQLEQGIEKLYDALESVGWEPPAVPE